jgi:hypothetical protein
MQSPARVRQREYVLRGDKPTSGNLEGRTSTIISSHGQTIKCHLTQPPPPTRSPLFFLDAWDVPTPFKSLFFCSQDRGGRVGSLGAGTRFSFGHGGCDGTPVGRHGLGIARWDSDGSGLASPASVKMETQQLGFATPVPWPISTGSIPLLTLGRTKGTSNVSEPGTGGVGN